MQLFSVIQPPRRRNRSAELPVSVQLFSVESQVAAPRRRSRLSCRSACSCIVCSDGPHRPEERRVTGQHAVVKRAAIRPTAIDASRVGCHQAVGERAGVSPAAIPVSRVTDQGAGVQRAKSRSAAVRSRVTTPARTGSIRCCGSHRYIQPSWQSPCSCSGWPRRLHRPSKPSCRSARSSFNVPPRAPPPERSPGCRSGRSWKPPHWQIHTTSPRHSTGQFRCTSGNPQRSMSPRWSG